MNNSSDIAFKVSGKRTIKAKLQQDLQEMVTWVKPYKCLYNFCFNFPFI